MAYAERVDSALLVDRIIGRVIKDEDLIDGIPMFYAPATMKACGLVVAGTIALNNSSTGGIIPVIIYDNLYNKLSKDGKDYVVCHELSHICNGDYARKINHLMYLVLCKLFVPKIEALADLGCSKRIGIKRTVSGMINIAKSCKSGYIQTARRIAVLCIYSAFK